MMTFETAVHINRPVEDVFDYVAEPLNFPQWNSAVQAVRSTSPGELEVGSSYVMERELPGGRAENRLEIVARDRPREFAMRTTTGPTPLLYRYRFDAADGGTDMTLDAEVELTGIASLAVPLAKRAVKRGVDDNLATLKGRPRRAGVPRPDVPPRGTGRPASAVGQWVPSGDRTYCLARSRQKKRRVAPLSGGGHGRNKTHITEVRTVAVPVTDQDRALEFYVGALGFEKRMDATFGGGRRWIEVAPSAATTTIALAPLGPDARAGVDTGIRLITEDAEADHADLRARGVDTDPRSCTSRRAADVLAARPRRERALRRREGGAGRLTRRAVVPAVRRAWPSGMLPLCAVAITAPDWRRRQWRTRLSGRTSRSQTWIER